MTEVTELGYVGLTVSDVEAWKHYASDIIGMEVRSDGEAGQTFLRLDNNHHRIVLRQGPQDDLQYLGWRVSRQTDLEAIARLLRDFEIEFRYGSEAEAQERHVLGLLKLKDPAGIETEIFYGPEVNTKKPFHPGRPMHGKFKTGNGGLGHCFLRQPDRDAAFKFYSMLGLIGGVEYKRLRPGGASSEITFGDRRGVRRGRHDLSNAE